jgi:hypothetical protein
MAVVTMTFEDTEHGTISIDGDVQPPIVDGEERTPAQELGFRILQELYAIQESGRLQRMSYGVKGMPDGQN